MSVATILHLGERSDSKSECEEFEQMVWKIPPNLEECEARDFIR